MVKSLVEFVYEKKVYLFGTGTFSKWMSNYLRKNNVEIAGYIVSHKREKDFMNRSVFFIGDIEFTDGDCVIVAVIKREFLEEIRLLIKKYVKFSHIYYPEDHNDLKMFCMKCFRGRRRFLSDKRKKIDIFNYREITRSFSFEKSPRYFRDISEKYGYYWCMNYGIDRCLKKYLKSCKLDDFQSTVIHGARFYTLFSHRELNPPNHNIFCMSSICFERVKDKICRNNIYSIGPYIKWVKPLLSKKKIIEIKRRLGKTLLVIPSHVRLKKVNGNIAFDTNMFLEEIERVKNKYGFRTVLVSIGPHTDMQEAINVYKKMDYKLISSGVPEDIYFLSRLRTFIEISDVAMGNDVWSTFSGYSISLNKPYYHFEQEIDYKDAKQHNDWLGLVKDDDKTEVLIKDEFLNCFSKYSENISKEQRAFVKKYWGNKRRLGKR